VTDKIQITGIRELQASLRKMDAGLPKKIRLALNEGTAEIVDYAQPRFPKKSGRAARSLRAASTQRAARVSMGGRRAPHAPWLVYGGEGRRRGRPPARPFIKRGRDFGPYAALDARRPRIMEIMSEALTDLARESGLEVS
jgi:hypothetical protein